MKEIICGFSAICTDYLIACENCANKLEPQSYFEPKEEDTKGDEEG